MNEVPQRIGDAERDRAIELLREHHAAGRLDMDEFDERMQQTLSAKTQRDLVPLFQDLPADPHQELELPTQRPAVPAQTGPKPGTTPSRRPAWVGLMPLLGPAMFVFLLATGFRFWWLWLVIFLVLPAIVRSSGSGPKRW